MDKVYLLLRNNQESGPFTIGELLQQQLKPSDMVWIEGKSTAWTYLSELELTPHVEKETPKPAASPSKSSDEIERKAEELRQKVLAAAPRAFQERETEIETYPSPFKLPDNEIHFMDYRKVKNTRRNTVLAELVLTCVVIGLFVFGIYKGKSFLGTKHQVQESVATQLSTNDEHAAQEHNLQPQQAVSLVQEKDSLQQITDSLAAIENARPKYVSNKRNEPDTTTLHLTVPVISSSDTNTEKKKEVIADKIQLPKEVPAKKEDSLKKEKTSTEDKADKDDSGKEEKKGFLRGLFKKKKKEDSSDKEDDKKKDSSDN
jgi:hypothetical protein